MPFPAFIDDYAAARRLASGEEPEVIEFLNRQPLKNVMLVGAIEEYGLENEQHKGVFYGCCGASGNLESVALIGHWVLLTEDLQTAPIFARLARQWHADEIEVVIGEEFTVEVFDRIFTAPPARRSVQSTRPQHLFAIREIHDDLREVGELRPARMDELEEVVESHARACLEVHGYDKRAHDPEGFSERVRSRVETGRVWIARDAQGVVFKCDVVMATAWASYLEGIWTRPDARGIGFSTNVMKALCSNLLRERPAVCLYADAENEHITNFYERVGFRSIARSRLTRYGETT